MYPGLSISRSLGDILAHHIGVTSEPMVKCYSTEAADRFIVIASDGIWDLIDPEEVIEVINDYGLKDPGTSSELICTKVKDMCS